MRGGPVIDIPKSYQYFNDDKNLILQKDRFTTCMMFCKQFFDIFQISIYVFQMQKHNVSSKSEITATKFYTTDSRRLKFLGFSGKTL